MTIEWVQHNVCIWFILHWSDNICHERFSDTYSHLYSVGNWSCNFLMQAIICCLYFISLRGCQYSQVFGESYLMSMHTDMFVSIVEKHNDVIFHFLHSEKRQRRLCIVKDWSIWVNWVNTAINPVFQSNGTECNQIGAHVAICFVLHIDPQLSGKW